MSVSPQEAKEELERLAEKNGGRLTPDAVVESAKSKKSPLHGYFDWDDSTAARSYRIIQARELIRSIRVEVRTPEMQTKTVPFFVRDPAIPTTEQGYLSISRVKSSESMARATVIHEFGCAAAALKRARDLAAVLNMEEAVDAEIVRIDDLRAKAEGLGAEAH